ncbi:MAG: hypothetical protein F6J97_24080 [Leptolyngbya sp. SIO4C1]|nr:hypothetical protein [Leptolyngbya sp. SIO4C1]
MSIISSNSAAGSVECPKCGKRAIVNHSDYQYHCLNCSFHRDLSAQVSTRRRGAERTRQSQRRDRSTQSVSRNSERSERSYQDSGTATAGSQQSSEMHPVVFVLFAILFGILVL